jgi:hypothetical protein
LGICKFPEAGDFTFQVWFSSRAGEQVLKAEQTFEIVAEEVWAMPKKSRSVHIAPLQRVVGEPITDPAELARLDALRKRVRLRPAEKVSPAKAEVHLARLQRMVAEPIADPAEKAASDERRRRHRAGLRPHAQQRRRASSRR